MDNFFLSAIVTETAPVIGGRSVSKIWLTRSEIFLDFRLPDDKVLIVSLDQRFPALYLGNLDTKSSDSQSSNTFLLQLRKKLSGARLIQLSKPALDRMVFLEFEGYDAGGTRRRTNLALALMGRSSNAYLTDENGIIETRFFDRGSYDASDQLEINIEQKSFDHTNWLHGLNDSLTEQDILEKYFHSGALSIPLIKREFIFRCQTANPVTAFRSLIEDIFDKKPRPLVYSKMPLKEIADRPADLKNDLLISHFELTQAEGLNRLEFDSLSEATEQYQRAREKAQFFFDRLSSLKRLLATRITKLEGLLKALAKDRARHGNPEQLKHRGDLLLANLATARVHASKATVVDYYDEQQPEIEIEIEEGNSLQQAAAKYFSRYQKARRAVTVIEEREQELQKQIEPLKSIAQQLEQQPTSEQVAKATERIESLVGAKAARALKKSSSKKPKSKDDKKPGRWFMSSDGYEIGVGRNDKDNDYLTFRLARSQDTWLHAGDYPGSHVLIRNPNKSDVPLQTLIEAAQLAAFYSQAKNHPKASVHYTQKKFVSKPPRAKPGLVRLSSFKTLFVEPAIKVEVID
jgi:predicted ribosome quality control (RQC) complex YloA/Tae2 family protein